jgi:hypothetical protein
MVISALKGTLVVESKVVAVVQSPAGRRRSGRSGGLGLGLGQVSLKTMGQEGAPEPLGDYSLGFRRLAGEEWELKRTGIIGAGRHLSKGSAHLGDHTALLAWPAEAFWNEQVSPSYCVPLGV